MNLETRKNNLIDWITNMPNEGLIEYLELLKNRDNDYLDKVSDNVRIVSGLTTKQGKELDRRYEYVLKHPDEGKTWEEIEKVL